MDKGALFQYFCRKSVSINPQVDIRAISVETEHISVEKRCDLNVYRDKLECYRDKLKYYRDKLECYRDKLFHLLTSNGFTHLTPVARWLQSHLGKGSN